MSASPPFVVVLAGPNGAGKSSAAPYLLQGALRLDTFVNADVIAQGLSGFGPDAVAVKAGRVMLGWLQQLAARRANFAFETTLSGSTMRQQLLAWKAVGYAVHLLYLRLPTAELAVARVRHRVESGGHDVPEAVIRRRYTKSLFNLERLYRPIATTWRVYDGSAPSDRPLIAYGEDPSANPLHTMIPDGALLDRAMVASFAHLVQRHRKLGRPLVIGREGQVVEVPADEVPIPDPGIPAHGQGSTLPDGPPLA